MTPRLIEEPPPVADYMRLRQICGLSRKSRAAAEIGLANSLYGVHLVDDHGAVIAMGRVIGDGGCFFQVVDIAVAPEYQKRGLSRRIMDAICAFIDRTTDDTAFVNLFADVDYLYQKYGFVAAAPRMIGMYRPRGRRT